MTKYVILGAGIAGLEAAKAIRKNDQDADISLISAEKEATYYRIKLTHALETEEKATDLAVEKEDFYRKNKIDLILDCHIKEIDFDKKVLISDDGRNFAYDKLLMATGSSPFIPPFEGKMLENMTAIRTIEDVENLRDSYPLLKKILVVGGGLLGLEAAYALHDKGFEVQVAEFSDRLLVRQLDPETADLLKKRLSDLGLKIHLGASLKKPLGDKKVEGALLTDGSELSCDAIVFSVGIRSNIELAGQGLDTNRGIIVDKKLQTGRRDVWAAGDVAEINGMTMGLWTAAMEMGKIVGANMTGGREEYSSPMLFTNLRIGDIKIFSIGSRDGEMVKIEGKDSSFAKLFFDEEEKFIGAILYENTRPMTKLKKAYKEAMNKRDLLETFEY